MNKNIFLLSTFLLINTSRGATPFNPKTYGLSEESCNQLQKDLGIGWSYVIEYLTKNSDEITLDVNNNYNTVRFFHWGINEKNAHDLAQMKACESCLCLGELVNQSPDLKNILSKISKAHDQLAKERIEAKLFKEKIDDTI